MKIKVGIGSADREIRERATQWLEWHIGHKVTIAVSRKMLELSCTESDCKNPKFLRVLEEEYQELLVKGRVQG